MWTFINFIHMIPLGSKLTPDPGGHKLEHRNKEDQFQNSSSLKLEGIELRFLVCSVLVDLCQFYSYDVPWDQNWSQPGGHKFEPKERRCRAHLWGKMTQVSDQGPSWPSCYIFPLTFKRPIDCHVNSAIIFCHISQAIQSKM